MIENNKIPDWNKDQVWDKVQDRLHKKKRRRFFFWWFFGGAGALLIGLMFWMNYSTPQQSEIALNNNAINENINTNKTINEPTTSTEILQKEVLSENIKNIVTSQTEKLQSNTEIIAPKESTKKYKVQKSETNFSNKNTNTFIQEVIEVKKESINTYSNNEVLSKEIKDEIIPAMSERTLLTADYLSTNSIGLLDNELPILKLDSLKGIKFYEPFLNPINSPNSLFSWYIESGIDFGNRTDWFENEINENRSAESFRFINTNTIGFQKEFQNRLSLNVGFSYQTIYEKYENTTVDFNETIIETDTAVIYNLANEIQYIESGELIETTENSRSIINNNLLHRWSIPVSVGYSFRRNRLHLLPSVGIRMRLNQRFNGIIEYDTMHNFDEDFINETYYSNKFDIGLMFSLSTNYQINKNVSFGLKVRYEKEDILGFTKSKLISSSHYETVGVHIGYFRSF